jgi:hypothetical protein
VYLLWIHRSDGNQIVTLECPQFRQKEKRMCSVDEKYVQKPLLILVLVQPLILDFGFWIPNFANLDTTAFQG